MTEEPSSYAADPAAIAKAAAIDALQRALDLVQPPVPDEKGRMARDRSACMCVVPINAVRLALDALIDQAGKQDSPPAALPAAEARGVVDDAMVERAKEAALGVEPNIILTSDFLRAILTAALTGERNG